MKGPLLAGLVAVMALSACSGVRESRLNPFNWFGGSQAEERTLAPRGGYGAEEADPRPLVDRVIALQVDRTPGGAIVSAIGLPPTQGWWAAELVPVNADIEGRPVADGGVLGFEFRIVPPPGPRRSGTPPSREVSAGLFVTDQELAEVRSVTVAGADNQRSARR